MPRNDWTSREPPSLGPVRPGHSDAAAPGPELRLPYGGRPAADRYERAAAYDDDDEPRRGGIGRKLAYAALAVAGLLGIGVAALIVAPPVDLVRAHVVAEVERQTGRKLTMGTAGVSFASGLGVALGDVALSAPPGMGGEPLLTSARVEVSLALLPLVMGDVRIDRLTLVKPVVHLRVDREGRRSWEFAGVRGGRLGPPLRYAKAPGTATDAGMPPEVADFMRNASPPRRVGPSGLEALSLSDVRIAGGTIRYADARSAFARELTGLDATVSLPVGTGSVALQGDAVIAGERVAVSMHIDNVRDMLADRSTGVRAGLEGAALQASFTGKAAAGARPFGDGKLTVRAPSATRLAGVFGLPLTGAEGVGAVAIDGQLRATGESVLLTSATVAAGQSSGTGTLGLELAGERPRVVANMRFDQVDLARFKALGWEGDFAASAEAEAPSAGRFAAPAVPHAAPDTPPSSIGDLLSRGTEQPAGVNPATRVKGFRQRLSNQWDVEPIEAGALRAIDVEARVQVTALRTETLAAENLQVGVELNGGVLRLTVNDGKIAGGSLRGLASIDARQPSLAVSANFAGESLAVKPLLALAGIDLIDGHGRLVAAITAEGASERELVSTLAGRAEIHVTDGAMIGWDADAIIADLSKGKMPPSGRNLDARTPFKQMSGNFQLAQGVARSRDLKLDSKVVTASGTATINIVDRNVDITLKPRIGPGGLEVPVRIAGAWEAPKLVADVAGALNSPQAQKAVRNLKEGDVDGALRSVLGNGPKAEQKIDKAKELLRGILGR
jgi:AsmA protein